MKFLKMAVLSAAMLFSATAAAENISYGNMSAIEFWKDHPGALIQVQTDAMKDTDNCGRKDFYILPDAHEHSKQIYALLLAAQVAGQKVQIWTYGCTWGFPVIFNAIIMR